MLQLTEAVQREDFTEKGILPENCPDWIQVVVRPPLKNYPILLLKEPINKEVQLGFKVGRQDL